MIRQDIKAFCLLVTIVSFSIFSLSLESTVAKRKITIRPVFTDVCHEEGEECSIMAICHPDYCTQVATFAGICKNGHCIRPKIKTIPSRDR